MLANYACTVIINNILLKVPDQECIPVLLKSLPFLSPLWDHQCRKLKILISAFLQNDSQL